VVAAEDGGMTTTQTATTAGREALAGHVAAVRYRLCAIPAETLAQLRMRDDAGRSPRIVVEAEGGSPLRCCLRPIRPGERVALVSYAPLRRWARETGADPGPYEETGPVFIHPEPCPGPAHPGGDGAAYPAALAGRPRVLRAYAADGHILGGRLFGVGEPDDAAAAATALAGLFTDPAVALVHVRAVEFGCFLFEARRT
jgi:Protein of unknown function (DUF1203)